MSARLSATISRALWIAILLSGAVYANDIYKWTDAEGNTIYGDNPPRGVNAQRVEIRSRPTDRARVAATTRARSSASSQRAVADADAAAATNAAAAAPTLEEQRAVAAERAARCSQYREQLQSINQSRRLYREDENGERVYLDEAEMQAARNNTQDKVQEYCDP